MLAGSPLGARCLHALRALPLQSGWRGPAERVARWTLPVLHQVLPPTHTFATRCGFVLQQRLEKHYVQENATILRLHSSLAVGARTLTLHGVE